RADIDARLAAAVRAQVPHRSKLTANPALMDVYTRVVTEEVARAAAKAAEPKVEKPPKPEGEPKTKRVTKKKEAPAPGTPAAAKPATPVMPPRPTPTPMRSGTPAYAGQRPPMPPSQQSYRSRPAPYQPRRSNVQPSKPRPAVTPMAERKIEIIVPITIKSFCEQTGIKVSQVIKKLMDQGAMVLNQNATLD